MEDRPTIDSNGNAPGTELGDKMAQLDISQSSTENKSTSDVKDEDQSAEIDAEKLASDMQARCRKLLNELEQFQAHLKKQRKEHTVELRTFRSGLQAEMKLIDKVHIPYILLECIC
jgi:hypothetical protein